MQVLVTGGRGFIGRHCVEALKAGGHSVRILSHSGPQSAEVAIGDVTNASSLPSALVGIDAVVHCEGIIVEPNGVTFGSVVSECTRNLVEACKHTRVLHWVFVSALGTRPNASARYDQTE